MEERRVLAERVTYNAEGNRVEDEWYDDEDSGTLIKKTVYRYVRGEKLAAVVLLVRASGVRLP